MTTINFAREAILSLQNFLKENGYTALKECCGVSAKSDGTNIIFNYGIEPDWTNPIPHVCRGLVLCAETYAIRAAPLFKFFNLNEPHAAKIDWDSSTIFEKLDGTMVCRFFDPKREEFVYTTRYQLPHEVETNTVHDSGITWRELIDKCVGPLEESIQQKENETIVLEVMSPLNRVVVMHRAFKASVLMRRNNETLEELDLRDYPLAPKTYSFSSPEEIVSFAHTLKGTEQEGFVVVDKDMQRVKIKGEKYVQLHLLRSNQTSSMKALIKAVRHGEADELEAYFPEYREAIAAVKKTVADQVRQHEAALEKLNSIEDQKEFALKLFEENLSANDLVFSVRAGKYASIADAVESYDDYRYARWLKPIVDKLNITLVSLEG